MGKKERGREGVKGGGAEDGNESLCTRGVTALWKTLNHAESRERDEEKATPLPRERRWGGEERRGAGVGASCVNLRFHVNSNDSGCHPELQPYTNMLLQRINISSSYLNLFS